MKLSYDARDHDEPAPLGDEPLLPLDHPVSIAMARMLSNTLMLWRLCLSARCQRNGKCKGDPHACLAIGGALLSDDVFYGGVAFLQGKADGLSFDDVLAQCPDELAAFGEWARRIEINPARRR
jgi:hypothetical protein